MAPPTDPSALSSSSDQSRATSSNAKFNFRRPFHHPTQIRPTPVFPTPVFPTALQQQSNQNQGYSSVTIVQAEVSPSKPHLNRHQNSPKKETEEEDFFNYKRSGCLGRLSLKNRKRKREASSSVIQTTPATSNLNNIQVKTEQPYKDLEESQDKRSKVDSQGSETKMMNGHNMHYASGGNGGGSTKSFFESINSKNNGGGSVSSQQPPVASLANLGNTCFLNSVLYTLRFTPGFLHSLHHLVYDLGLHPPATTINASSNGGKKMKNLIGNSSSFIVGGGGSSGTNGGNGGVGNGTIADAETELVHDVVDQLHDLFRNMSCTDGDPEASGSTQNSSSAANGGSVPRDPIAPNSFLQAVGKLNPMFEGNQQQDAHELLVTVLNTLQDIKIPAPAPAPETSLNGGSDVVDHARTSPLPEIAPSKKGKDKKKGGKSIFYTSSSSNSSSHSNGLQVNGLSSKSSSKHEQVVQANNAANSATAASGKQPAAVNTPVKPIEVNSESQMMPNFVKDNFVGKSVMRTRCLECEASTYRSETFTNIDIPLTFDEGSSGGGDSRSSGLDDSGNGGDTGGGGGGGGRDESAGQAMFLKQIMASETLRENNKYWCSECSRLNEAQRSVSYEVLPRVMVLQLKRFTASGAKSYTSKINEYIPTPFTMNCFCSQCMPPPYTCTQQDQQPGSGQVKGRCGPGKHHYQLYAVIMHLGATLASGHYTAYVRASNEAVVSEYLRCSRRPPHPEPNSQNGPSSMGSPSSAGSNNGSNKKSSKQNCDKASVNGNGGSKGIMKYFQRSSEARSSGHTAVSSSSSSQASSSGGQSGEGGGGSTGCKSASCCGVRAAGHFASPSSTSSSSSSSASASSSGDAPTPASSSSGVSSAGSSLMNGGGFGGQKSVDSIDSSAGGGGGAGDTSHSSSDAEEVWLECDDETIHVMSKRQLLEDLSTNRGFTTPYLLFYQKV